MNETHEERHARESAEKNYQAAYGSSIIRQSNKWYVYKEDGELFAWAETREQAERFLLCCPNGRIEKR